MELNRWLSIFGMIHLACVGVFMCVFAYCCCIFSESIARLCIKSAWWVLCTLACLCVLLYLLCQWSLDGMVVCSVYATTHICPHVCVTRTMLGDQIVCVPTGGMPAPEQSPVTEEGLLLTIREGTQHTNRNMEADTTANNILASVKEQVQQIQ